MDTDILAAFLEARDRYELAPHGSESEQVFLRELEKLLPQLA